MSFLCWITGFLANLSIFRPKTQYFYVFHSNLVNLWFWHVGRTLGMFVGVFWDIWTWYRTDILDIDILRHFFVTKEGFELDLVLILRSWAIYRIIYLVYRRYPVYWFRNTDSGKCKMMFFGLWPLWLKLVSNCLQLWKLRRVPNDYSAAKHSPGPSVWRKWARKAKKLRNSSKKVRPLTSVFTQNRSFGLVFGIH